MQFQNKINLHALNANDAMTKLRSSRLDPKRVCTHKSNCLLIPPVANKTAYLKESSLNILIHHKPDSIPNALKPFPKYT